MTDCSFTAFGTWTVSGARTIGAHMGFSVAIPCTPPAANPAPLVVWQRDGVDIAAGDPLNGGTGDRVQVLPSGHLVIHALETSDYAVVQYRCSVRNVRTHSTSQSPQTFTLMNGMHCLQCVYMHIVTWSTTSWTHCKQRGYRCNRVRNADSPEGLNLYNYKVGLVSF